MRVIVGLSGGVDSSVASYLLQKEGHEVIGLTFQFQSCGKDDAVSQAKAVAGKLNFSHYVVDVKKDFEDGVLKNSWNLYSNSRTPNPCALCNQFVKFPSLLKYAGIINADYVATGHYAISDNGLYRGRDRSKDQSYFLYSLKELNRIKFPLGNYTKIEIKKIADEIGLPNAKRKESQDLCINVDNFPEMLRERYGGEDLSGNIIKGNKVIGKHSGVYNFTIGQRKRALGNYVVGLNGKDVVVNDNPFAVSEIKVKSINWIGEFCEDVMVQTRYRQMPCKARINRDGDVKFSMPQYSIASGQVAVFYDGDRVVGGGIIE